MSACREIEERVATGTPLGALAAHVTACASCARIVAVPAQLARTGIAADEPAPGFAARATAGARAKLAARRRRRAIGTVVAAAACSAFAIVALTRPARPDATEDDIAAIAMPPPTPEVMRAPRLARHPNPPIDPDVRALVRFARLDHAWRPAVGWAALEAPLSPYRRLVMQGGSP